MARKKFWTGWREEDFDEAHFAKIKNAPVSDEVKKAVFANRPAHLRRRSSGS